MKIKTIIPILNPPQEFFKNILPRLYTQTQSHQIILINSGADLDETKNYKIINIDKNEFNHANTRNIVLNFEADFYLFMTQDATACDDNLISHLLKPFIDSDVVVSYAKQTPYKNAHITEKFARETNYPNKSLIKSKKDIKDLGIKTYFSSDSCAMYRSDYFKEVNGFKKNLNGSEDMEFAARAIWNNKKIAYCSKAKVFHSHIYTTKTLFKRYLSIGKFFKENSWIEASIEGKISTEKTGFRQVLNEYKYILKNKPLSIFYAIYLTFIKYIAYKIGKAI